MKIRISAFLMIAASFVITTWVLAQTKPVGLEISWTAPTTNTDGSPYNDADGYHLCLALQPIPADLTLSTMSANCAAALRLGAAETSTTTELDITVPESGTIYARVAAVDTDGNVSVFSDEASVPFDFLPAEGTQISVTIRKR